MKQYVFCSYTTKDWSQDKTARAQSSEILFESLRLEKSFASRYNIFGYLRQKLLASYFVSDLKYWKIGW